MSDDIIPINVRFVDLAVKMIAVHTATYFVMGLLAMEYMDYARLFAEPFLRAYMRPLSDATVAAGPLFQPIRGLLFALAIYPIRETIFTRKNGWAILWLLLAVLGIFSTFGPSPGSLEGIIYASPPLKLQLMGLPEVLLQSLFLSAIVCYWIRHPGNRRLAWGIGILFTAAILSSVLGIIMSPA